MRTRLALVLAVAPPLGLAAGFAAGLPWLIPLLLALPAWGILIRLQAEAGRERAIGLMLWWALWLAASGVAMSLLFPQRAAAVILNGVPYRDEMFSWLSTGAGRESSPALFVPQHLLHLAIFSALALASAGALALVMGSFLLNYMSFYVAELIRACEGNPDLPRALLLAFNPWSIVRVVAFIILGVVLAEPILARWLPGARTPGRMRWIGIAAGGILADLLLKALLAPLWPGLLGGCLIDGV